MSIDLADHEREARARGLPARSCGWTFVPDDVAPMPPDAHFMPIPLQWLDGTRRDERWLEGSTGARETEGELTFFSTDKLLGGLLDEREQGALDATTAEAYQRIQCACAQRGFPHLLRFWNFFGAINEGDYDDERYRRFCVGRAQTLTRSQTGGYPAATAIGIPGPPGRMQVAFLASRHPGEAIENPRQTSAWNYPRKFGPVAPGFSRAMLLPWLPEPLLLVSGTASVVGHATVHTSTATQLAEALRNVGAVIDAAAARLDRPVALGVGSGLRVYLRDAREARAVALQLRESLPADVAWMLLHGDVCRADLRVELELLQACPRI